MNELGRLVAFLFLLGLLAGTACAEAGLALPRFVSLRSDEVNLRTGPGTNYPVEWVYVRRGLPVEIIAEFDNWRKVRDIEGTVGWIHKSLLSGKRMAVILGEEETLHRSPDATARVVLKAARGVLGEIIACKDAWCRLEITEIKGWIRRDRLWGVYPTEELP